MEKQVLSIEQCQELTALGLDMSDASMIYIKNIYPNEDIDWTLCVHTSYFKENITKILQGKAQNSVPTFTLQDILKKIPVKYALHYIPNVGYTMELFVRNGWNHEEDSNSSPLEAAFNMLKWCLKNKYI